MGDTVAGFPFWKLAFDKDGAPVDAGALAQFRNEVKGTNISDLFIFSHGWNNDQQTASQLYQKFFGEMRKILDQSPAPAGVTIGTAGVFWPSIMWPDQPASNGGGAASFGGGAIDIGGEMKKVFQEPSQQQTIDQLTSKLQAQQSSDAAINGFISDLRGLLSNQPSMPEYHDLEQKAAGASTEQWRQVLDALADSEPAVDTDGGAAGLGDMFSRLWQGAKAALR